jgi:hypothetical protein
MGEICEGGEGPYWIVVPSKKKKKNKEKVKKKRMEAI